MAKRSKIRRAVVNFAKLVWHTFLWTLGLWSKSSIGIASRWGKIEHAFGVWTGRGLVLTMLISYYKWGKSIRLDFVCLCITFVFWGIYRNAHKLEKWTYGGGLRISTIAGR
ncbi:hypothetical protein A3K73_01020 [Candidatus Pacearchaeota archaeon RBG_13_36_9]|nr:MAG: hypothetical protein A3K73_01020 [Candidatus Pacearchaeota archaeon RBG_13_36_9]